MKKEKIYGVGRRDFVADLHICVVLYAANISRAMVRIELGFDLSDKYKFSIWTNICIFDRDTGYAKNPGFPHSTFHSPHSLSVLKFIDCVVTLTCDLMVPSISLVIV